MLNCLLPEGRGTKLVCAGLVGFIMMLVTLYLHLEVYMFQMVGRPTLDNPLCRLHHPLQSFPFCHSAVPVPHTDARAQNTLYRTSIKR